MAQNPNSRKETELSEGVETISVIDGSGSLADPNSDRGNDPANRDGELHLLNDDIQHNRWHEALLRCRRLLRSGVAIPGLHATCGNVLQHLGQLPAALDAFRSALALGGETSALHDAAGLCCLRLRDFEGASAHFRRALDLHGQQAPMLLLHLGMALLEGGRAEEAGSLLHQVIQIAPEMAPAHFYLGQCAEARHQPSEALAHYGDTLRHEPRHAAALSRAGHILIGQGRMEEAMTAFRRVLGVVPDDPMALVRIGQILTARGMLREAEVPLRRALARNAGHADAWAALGQVQVGLGALDEDAHSYARALRAQPHHLTTRLAQIALSERQGQDDEVREQARALLTTHPQQPQLLVTVGRLARSKEEREEALIRLEAALQAGERLGRDNESIMSFAAGTLHDKLGRPPEAFGHFQRANAYQNSIKPYRREQVAEYFGRIRERIAGDVLRRLPQSRNLDERPIFIFGMPLSGTSLAEQILASHTDVFGAGELRSLDNLLRPNPGAGPAAPGYPNDVPHWDCDTLDRTAQAYLDALPGDAQAAKRVTDKMPHNFQYAGLIHKLFPRARIVHCTRDPRDIGLSCYFQYFAEGNSFSYDLGDFAHYYRQYRLLMEHWKQAGVEVFELCYENLVSDPEPMVRALLDHCGLDWHDACLKFHDNRRVVHTASYKQVREPFHGRSIGRWKAYEPFLAPLLEELGEWIEKSQETPSAV